MRTRIESVDLLRGVIMIIMALDHVREFYGVAANPTDLATTTPALFFTRWITHFCAPVFFLLTGTGAFLSLRRKSVPQLSHFLWTRGLWLIFLEVVVTRCLGWQFNFDYRLTLLFVLWALGWSMITLSVLIRMPTRYVTAFGVGLIVVHNLMDGVSPASFGSLSWLWSILHVPGMIVTTPRFTVFEAYPLIPWIGVTAAGYGLGQVFNWDEGRRRAFLLQLGLGLSAAFVLLRAANICGDPNRWSVQRSTVFTILSFLNTTKYPPSLLFLLMTLGPAMLFLRAVDGRTPSVLRPAVIIGKVPMFYYILHITIAHSLAVILCYARYGDAHWMFQSPDLSKYPITFPPGWGFGLPGVYLVWAIVVLILFPACVWYARLKQRRSDWWLSYV
ncbi:MAG: heparan-alpha-glucosaminide N-acetyltransferase domain-containing protein [Gemmatimonadota bacterium]|nr:heparan-alpha-glucosaminide N-acetyltransferase domain-containing protein [Gemmatimonadota bacterium]